MQIGDLVRLKKHCANSHELAMIVGVHRNAIKILLFDSGKKIPALVSNLEVISESR